ncbi:hypothetical protein B0H63DRAFT_545659 [Podospora didyma]|uniref:CFEM domain-containing protein n=1 Tax=Podospora didyma TaxID=330526 RepID=A0AAE0NGQ2_9PEZI|nr:hypothetical protein B0H63DRAFT_545659 [Podospora didyma]
MANWFFAIISICSPLSLAMNQQIIGPRITPSPSLLLHRRQSGLLPQCALSCVEDARIKSTDCNYGDLNCLCTGDNAVNMALGSSDCVINSCGKYAALGIFNQDFIACSLYLYTEARLLGTTVSIISTLLTTVNGLPVAFTIVAPLNTQAMGTTTRSGGVARTTAVAGSFSNPTSGGSGSGTNSGSGSGSGSASDPNSGVSGSSFPSGNGSGDGSISTGGAIAGIVVGCVLGTTMICAAAFLIYWYRKKAKIATLAATNTSGSPGGSGDTAAVGAVIPGDKPELESQSILATPSSPPSYSTPGVSPLHPPVQSPPSVMVGQDWHQPPPPNGQELSGSQVPLGGQSPPNVPLGGAAFAEVAATGVRPREMAGDAANPAGAEMPVQQYGHGPYEMPPNSGR